MFDGVGALVLAAGKGTRMHSEVPKVLRTILGEPMLAYVLQALSPLCRGPDPRGGGTRRRVRAPDVPGHGRRLRGAGRAARHRARPADGLAVLEAAGYDYVLVVNGDVPLLTTDILAGFVAEALSDRADVGLRLHRA